jgi:dihydroflavonol-4-reductase
MENLSKESCLVTGGAGFVGAALVRELRARGYSVRVLLRRKEAAMNLDRLQVEIFIANILDTAAVREAVRDIDYVFHTASLYEATPFYDQKADRMYEVNVVGTRNICEACLQGKVKKLIYTGSTGAVGLRDDGKPANEAVILNHLELRSHYEKSKAEAERLALSYHNKGLSVVSVNPSFLVGEGDMRPSPTGEVIVKFLNGYYPCYFDATLCLSDLPSTIDAHIRAMESGRSGERYIVVSDQLVSVKEFFGMLEDVSGIKKPFLRLPIKVLALFAMLNELLIGLLGLRGRMRPLISHELLRYLSIGASYDSTKAKKELEFCPEPLKEVLRKSVYWFMRNGYIRKGARAVYFRHIGKL